MSKKRFCLMLILALTLTLHAAAESDVATVDADGVHFLSAGITEVTLTAETDGPYFLLLPVTAPLLTSQQQMWQLCHLCSSSNLLMVHDNVVTQQVAFSGDPALLTEEITVSARPGLTEYAFRLAELKSGEYALTLNNLTGGEVNVPLRLCPVQRLEALPAAMSAAESQAYAIPLAEARPVAFTLSGAEACSVSFFTDADPTQAWQLQLSEGESEASAILELPAGELMICFSGDDGVLAAE